MKKVILAAAACAALAIPSSALADASGDGSGYHPQGSACGQYHGAFDAFGKDNNFAGGADGQATGDANSVKGCQVGL
jgi:hypothetical protein